MKLGIKAKLLVALVITATVPIIMGLATIHFVGRCCYRDNKGELYRTRAAFVASRLNDAADDQIGNLDLWLSLSDVSALVDREGARNEAISLADFHRQVADMDARWASLEESGPELQALLDNDIARSLRTYQSLHPQVVELFITDRRGRLIASSEKTSDYWQGDENWWKKASRLGADRAWAEGIHFDESAGVYSLDFAMPIMADGVDGRRMVGVVKCVVNASQLMAALSPVPNQEQCRYDVIMSDGRVLASLFGRDTVPLESRIDAGIAARISNTGDGWLVETMAGGVKELIGFAALRFSGKPAGSLLVSGVTPMYVVVHNDLAAIMAPIDQQLGYLLLLGLLLLMLLAAVSVFLANHFIVRPLELLRSAAHSISVTASSRTAHRDEKPVAATHDLSVEILEGIHTGDEIETLAREFETMAHNLLPDADKSS